ncbi:MAG: hypothetical protein ACLURY_00005 [Alistipes putredinis]
MENVTGFAEKLNMNIIAGGEEPESNLSTKTVKLTLVTRMEKVILQTFVTKFNSRMRLRWSGPMCFLLWKGTGATDLTYLRMYSFIQRKYGTFRWTLLPGPEQLSAD